jgi:hypothetical protein
MAILDAGGQLHTEIHIEEGSIRSLPTIYILQEEGIALCLERGVLKSPTDLIVHA